MPQDVSTIVRNGVLKSFQVKRLAEVYPHEETIPERVEAEGVELIFDQEINTIYPIVVETSGVILDGMHRHAVAERLGFNAIFVQEVDYTSAEITLSRWCRRFKKVDESVVEAFFKKHGIESKRDVSEARIIRDSSQYFGFSNSMHVYREMQTLYELEKALRITEDCYAGDDCGNCDKRNFPLVIYPPILSKRDVVSLARAGRKLPPKSSHHGLPYRISVSDRDFRPEILSDFGSARRYCTYVRNHSNVLYLGEDKKFGIKYQIAVKRK